MKTLLLSLAAILTLGTSKAQFTQNFEGIDSSLTNNCWTMTNVFTTHNTADVITGTGSLYTNPPTTASATRDLITPALDVTSTNFQVMFKYKLSSAINGPATRTIEVGVLDASNVYTSLTLLTMDNSTPTLVHNFNTTYTLASTGIKKLVLKLGGTVGDGNSRLVLDDLWVNANPKYGIGTCNSAPIAVNDAFSGPVGTIITGNVMANDNEPNGEAMNAATVVSSPNGVLVLNPNGSFTFTPAIGFTGPTTSFTYRLNDNGFAPMSSNIATVTITYVTGTPLPVNLLYFSAMLNNNKVDLNWVTITEMNVSHFEVEKSTDGETYSTAGILLAMGNSSDKTNYSFRDNLAITDKVIYYRIRTVDNNGKTRVSEIKVIRVPKDSGSEVSILTYPNPVTTDLRITIPASWQNKKVTFEVYSVNGTLAVKKENSRASQTETVNIAQAAQGVYIVKVSCNGEVAQQKIIKQ